MRIRRRCRRGLAIGTSIAVAALLAVLACLLATLSASQLQLTARSNAQRVARTLAESAVSDAIARLRLDHAFGTALGGRTLLTSDNPNEQGILTFDPSEASKRDVATSTYNLGVENAAGGWGGSVVPGDCVQLIGTGRYHGIEHRVEVIVFFPRFPYVIAASGPLQTDGGLQVSSVREAAALENGIDNIPADQIVPGHLLTNARGGDEGTEAVVLRGRGNHVTGDVQTCGDVALSEETRIDGQLRTHSDPVRIPKINVEDYDTERKPGVLELPEAPSQGKPLVLEGYARRRGDLTISNGLRLRGGVLFVDGDLTVRGGVQGKGAIVATGSVRITGGGAVESDSMAALLAKGSVSLRGETDQHAAFKGLLYTEGNLRADNVTLIGTLIANSENEKSGGMRLTNAEVVQEPVSTAITFELGGADNGNTAFAQDIPLYEEDASTVGGAPGSGASTYPEEVFGGGDTGSWKSNKNKNNITSTPNPTTLTINYSPIPQPTSIAGSNETPDQDPPDPSSLIPLTKGGTQGSGTGTSQSAEKGWVTLSVTGSLKSGFRSNSRKKGIGGTSIYDAVDIVVSGQAVRSRADLIDALMSKDRDKRRERMEALATQLETDLRNHFYASLQELLPPSSPPPPMDDDTWTLDLSQFVSIEERLRVLSWRDL